MDIEDSKFSLSGSSEYLSQNIETKSFLPREYFTGHRSLFFVDLPALFCGRGRQRSLTVQRSSHVRMRVPKCKLAVRFSIAYRMTAKSVIRRVSAIFKAHINRSDLPSPGNKRSGYYFDLIVCSLEPPEMGGRFCGVA